MTTEDRARVVEEPAGFDHPATERIPVPGDLSDDRTDIERPDEAAGERVETVPAAEPVDRIERDEPVTEPTGMPVTGSVEPRTAQGFFAEDTVNRFRDRWRELQAGFVDDPERAVQGADELVDEIMRELAERKQNLGQQWRDGEHDTEELRVAIQEYRSFLNQLLNA